LKTHTLLYRFLSTVILLALLLPLSPTPSSMARREPSTNDDPLLPLDEYDEFVYLPLTLNNYPTTIYIPAGEFQMGCDSSNPSESCLDDEKPLHTVYLDAYTIDKYEVTNAQYAEFLNAEGNQEEGGVTWLDADASRVRIHESGGVWQADAGYEDHPVVTVSWYGARAYCQWQGKHLPTEAEWEKAARGSSDTRVYPWGNEAPDCSRLNYYDSTEGYCVGDTMPVGSYPSGASPYGAMDMAGNVWEWVNDWYLSNYYESSPYSNPPGPASGTLKVIRGGSWNTYWTHVRVASRPNTNPYGQFSYTGFRCADVAPGQ
jgi:formylglycine-generating enzyme required for sulfatase activity